MMGCILLVMLSAQVLVRRRIPHRSGIEAKNEGAIGPARSRLHPEAGLYFTGAIASLAVIGAENARCPRAGGRGPTSAVARKNGWSCRVAQSQITRTEPAAHHRAGGEL